jgi:hypothetical protein
MIFWKYFFKTLNQFTHVNKEIHIHASNIDGFPSRDACVSSMLLNRHIWNKRSLSPASNV